MGPALLFAGASSALDLMGGYFGYLASQDAAAIAESRGRMLRAEAEAEAQRYAEQARGLRAKQAVSYLKAGVTLEGSPLDVLDHDALIAEENISAIRAGGAARELEQQGLAADARIKGRNAFMAGISSGFGKFANAFAYSGVKTPAAGTPTNNTPYGGYGAIP